MPRCGGIDQEFSALPAAVRMEKLTSNSPSVRVRTGSALIGLGRHEGAIVQGTDLGFVLA
ncbi:hypothetical protein J4G37_16310 [Microvirga sp. 3-52]|nr:hypothetical protein [Microvirga sp. 3-52]